MFDTACYTILTCLSFLTVCGFYGTSVAFLAPGRRLQYGGTLALLVVILDIADIGPHVWWSLLVGTLFYIFAEALLSVELREVPLPVELTTYNLINNLFFLAPFLLVVLLKPLNERSGLATQLLTLLLLPCIWTIYSLAKLSKDPKFNYVRQLFFFWSLCLILFGVTLAYTLAAFLIDR